MPKFSRRPAARCVGLGLHQPGWAVVLKSLKKITIGHNRCAINRTQSPGNDSVMASRFELRTLYVSKLPVNFGINFNYQSTSWKNDNDQIKLSILSLGPLIQRFFYQEENMAISGIFGAEYAPIYRTSSGDSVEKYQSMILDLGLESLWATEQGKWSLGVHYRRHDLTLNESNRSGLEPYTKEITINSIGAMVGYKYEWNL